jgi:hypothetical protein
MAGTVVCKNGAVNPRDSAHWRLAVWGLRVIGPGLAVVGVGLVTLLWSTSTGQAILAVGMGIYLVGVLTTVVGIILVYREVPPPRPNLIWLRWSLLHDAVHARSASAEQVAEGTSPLAARRAQSLHMENLRHSAHWRLAVWGYRVMGTGLAVVVAGLITFLWSTAARIAILAVGIGIYFVSLVFTFVEVHRAYDDVQPPRPDYALVQQRLLHDALHARS